MIQTKGMACIHFFCKRKEVKEMAKRESKIIKNFRLEIENLRLENAKLQDLYILRFEFNDLLNLMSRYRLIDIEAFKKVSSEIERIYAENKEEFN